LQNLAEVSFSAPQRGHTRSIASPHALQKSA
jgi:hypothetical protein